MPSASKTYSVTAGGKHAIAHPAISSAIIGPRTIDQLEGLLAGADIILGDDVLDAIDAICPPGNNVSHDDDGYMAPEIADAQLRRRVMIEFRALDRDYDRILVLLGLQDGWFRHGRPLFGDLQRCLSAQEACGLRREPS